MARLFHAQPLVRSAACSVLEIVARRRGVQTWKGKVCACVTVALVDNFERQGDEHTSEEEAQLVKEKVELNLHAAGSGPFAVKPGSDALRHDTVGWKKLEAGFGALLAVLQGCGRSFVDDGFLTDGMSVCWASLLVFSCVARSDLRSHVLLPRLSNNRAV